MLREILKFYKLVLVSVWLEMFRQLSCIITFTMAYNVTGEDYLKDVTQKGLDYIRQVGVPFLLQELKTMPLPDISGKMNTPLSVFVYTLSKIKIMNADIKSSNITIDQKTGLTITFNDAEFEVTSKWTYSEKNWPHIRDSGDVDIHVRKVNLKIVIYLDSKNSKVLVRTRSCLLDIGYIDLHFRGRVSWLYNIFSGKIAQDLKGLVSKEVCTLLSHIIDNEGDKILQEVPEVYSSIKNRVLAIERMAQEANSSNSTVFNKKR